MTNQNESRNWKESTDWLLDIHVREFYYSLTHPTERAMKINQDNRITEVRYFKCLHHMVSTVIKVTSEKGVTVNPIPVPACPVMGCEMEETK